MPCGNVLLVSIASPLPLAVPMNCEALGVNVVNVESSKNYIAIIFLLDIAEVPFSNIAPAWPRALFCASTTV